MEPTVRIEAHPILANMSKGWRMQPAFSFGGREVDGFGAALWHQPEGGSHEVAAEPDPRWHVISIAQNTFEAEARKGNSTVIRGPVRAGSVQIMQAGVMPWAHHKGSFSLLHLYVSRAFVDRVMVEEHLDESFEVEFLDPHCAADPAMTVLGDLVLRELRCGRPLQRIRMETLMLKLVVELLCRHSNASKLLARGQRVGSGRLPPHKLSASTDYMLEHLSEDITLEQLASLVGLSTYHFCRAFKESVGATPYQWLITRRMERAQCLLSSNAMSVIDVALETGFNNPSHFATSFRKTVGMSPTAFQRSVLGRRDE